MDSFDSRFSGDVYLLHVDEYDLAGMCEERRNCTFLFEGRQECDENKITCASIGNYFQLNLSRKLQRSDSTGPG